MLPTSACVKHLDGQDLTIRNFKSSELGKNMKETEIKTKMVIFVLWRGLKLSFGRYSFVVYGPRYLY